MPSSEIPTEPLAITLFGPMQVRVQGNPLPQVRRRKALWLLALLTLHSHRAMEREGVAALLWPETDPSHAAANLALHLSELRKALGPQATRLKSPERGALRLDLRGAAVDVLAFDAAIKGGTLSDLERAVTLYSGPLLEGCNEGWVCEERTAREQDCLTALQRLGEAAVVGGDHQQAVSYYQRVVSLDPWQEGARRGWMEALAQSGDRNAALQVYRDFVEVLQDDPSAAPEAETKALYQRLRSGVRERVGTHVVVTAQVIAVPEVKGYLPHPLTN